MKFVAFYGSEENNDRYYSLTGNSVISYLYDCLTSIGIKVSIVSPAWYTVPHRYSKSIHETDSAGRDVIYTPSIGLPGKGGRLIKMVISWVWLVFFLCRNTRRGEKVLVYHTMNLIIPLMIAKGIKGLKYVTYCGELYQDVYDPGWIGKKLEFSFLNNSDAFILATRNLKNRITSRQRDRYIELYGSYETRINPGTVDTDSIPAKKIIVYSGKLDGHKGVINLIRASQELSDDYEIHILGFGEEESIRNLNDEIEKMREKKAKCRSFYDGVMTREELDQFLQKCYIGVCLQDTNTRYNSFAFPSKIITYLANGVPVLCSAIDVVRESKVADCTDFCNANDSQEVASCIMNGNWELKREKARSLVQEMDQSFREELQSLLKG